MFKEGLSIGCEIVIDRHVIAALICVQRMIFLSVLSRFFVFRGRGDLAHQVCRIMVDFVSMKRMRLDALG